MEKVEEDTVNDVVKEIGKTKSSRPDQSRIGGQEAKHLLPSNEESFIDIKNGKRGSHSFSSKIRPEQVQERILPRVTDSVVRLDETTRKSINSVPSDVEHCEDDEIKKNKKTLVSDRQMCYMVVMLSIINFMLSISFYIVFFTSPSSLHAIKNDLERRMHDVCITSSQIRNAAFTPKSNSMVVTAKNITWNPIVQVNSFVRLDDTGQRIIAQENGTYSIFVSLTVDSINCKTNRTNSMICLRNSINEKEKCAKVKLATNTTMTVTVREDIFLEIDDFFWVSGLKLDCGDPAYTYMTMIKY